MEEKLTASLAEALEMEVNQIRTEDKFRSYENYSSLTELSILALLDSEFGIELEMSEFNKYLTVGDLLQLVKSRSTK
jgi:acyl carrier protein